MNIRVAQKFCKKCLRWKPEVEFDRPNRCRSCSTKYKAEWAARNKDKMRVYRDNGKLKTKVRNQRNGLARKYGLTLVQHAELRQEQDNRCAICQSEFSEDTRLCHVDHDHMSGKVRGLLCFSCNNGLGNFKDDLVVLEAAVEYLKRVGGYLGR